MTILADVGRGVISERNELYGASWVDCTQAAAMRACADAGVVFPLADLDQEREALERADDRSDETGATIADIVTAMDRRYHYSGDAVTDLHAALRTPGYTLLVQGAYPQLPSIQRRWSPKFQGGHAVAYRVTSAILGTLLDPLAPMGFAGDSVLPAVMEAFAWGAATTRAMRWLQQPQSSTSTGDSMATTTITLFPKGPQTIAVGPGAVQGYKWDSGAGVMTDGTTNTFALASGTAADAYVVISGRGTFVRVVNDGRMFAGQLLSGGAVKFPNGDPLALPVAPPVPQVPDVKHTITLQIDGVTSFTKAV